MRKRIFSAMMLMCLIAAQAIATECPKDYAKVGKLLAKTFKTELQIKDITPSPAKALCQVAVNTADGVRILYTDPDLKHIFLGQLISAETAENLTREAMEKYNVLSIAQMAELKKLVAFKEGTSKNHVYLVTDPKCPFCKRIDKTLLDMIRSNEISVSVLFRPLPFHKGADKIAKSVICDNKGLKEVIEEYTSNSTCSRADELFKKTAEILDKANIRAVPVIISDNGKYTLGALPKAKIEELAKSR